MGLPTEHFTLSPPQFPPIRMAALHPSVLGKTADIRVSGLFYTLSCFATPVSHDVEPLLRKGEFQESKWISFRWRVQEVHQSTRNEAARLIQLYLLI